jgi:methionine-rich copper-binding protein CopC
MNKNYLIVDIVRIILTVNLMNYKKMRVYKLIMTIFLVGITSFIAQSPTNAHMGILSSDPSNGSEIKVVPKKLTLTFTKEVNLETVAVRIRFIGGVDTPITEISNKNVKTEVLTKLTGVGNGSTATFALPKLSNGLYVIDWSVAEIKGHTNSSSIVFKLNGNSELNGVKITAIVFLIVTLFIMVRLFLKRKRK